ncbi:MAG: cell envelope biogenesis protein LolA [Anaeromyxobacter sp. RBG_16_69_14]|nr:MAG: cell envelope biogenesis protein LolA [Anaeromyxobacter sp. RBG_16_69_14]
MASALLLLVLLSSATTPDASALGQRVQGYYEKTKDLEAGFVQTYTYSAAGRSQTSRGTLRVKKPGKLRWDYVDPAKKTIVVNGSRLVQYEPEENQAYVDEHFDASAMSAAVTFLLGKGKLEREFGLSAEAGGRLVLTPRKADARVERVVLTVSESGEVTATRVVDGSGNVNEIAFQNLRRNVGLKDDLFVVDLPKDVHRVKAPGQ